MRKSSKRATSILCLWAALSSPGVANAGGFGLFEIATPDTGLAAAGTAARAQDASTVFTNPAGMTLLEVPTLQVGAQVTLGHFEFESDPSQTTFAGNDGGNGYRPLPAGSFFYVHPFEDPEFMSLGIGISSYFALNMDFDEGWVGRYQAQQLQLITYSIMPAVSFQVAKVFSFGVGFNFLVGYLDDRAAVNNIDPSLDDGRLEYSDVSLGAGFDVGMMFEISERTRLGLRYLSPVRLDFENEVEFSGLGPARMAQLEMAGLIDAELEVEIRVPQSLMLSIYHAFDHTWAIMGNVGWEDWRQFGELELTVDSDNPSSLVVDRDYKSTAHVAVGARVRP